MEKMWCDAKQSEEMFLWTFQAAKQMFSIPS